MSKKEFVWKKVGLTHWFFDHFVIVWNFVRIHRLLKRDATTISLEKKIIGN